MIKKQAYVISKEGNKVSVGFKRDGMCDCCGGGCNVDCHSFEVESDLDLNAGDRVELINSSGWFVLSSFLTFVVPSILFIVILFVFSYNAFVGMFWGMFSLVVYFLLYKFVFVKRYSKQLKTVVVKL